MRQVSQSMGNVVKGMDSAMKAMDLEKVCDIPLLLLLPEMRSVES
jgi:division protein CdvB (Snf7/Vps24/ESCRT-III family)